MAKKRKSTKKQPVASFVQLLLDETGSMMGQERRVVDGVNEYINTLKAKKLPRCRVALTKFNSSHYTTVFEQALKDVKEMALSDYRPAAVTPLYDALGRRVREVEGLLKKGESVVFLIDTDGYENASREFDRTKIFELIKQKESDGWTFVFLGADMDAWAGSQSMGLGIARGNVASFTNKGRKAAYAFVGGMTVSHLTSGGGYSSNFTGGTSDLTPDDDYQDQQKQSPWCSGITTPQTNPLSGTAIAPGPGPISPGPDTLDDQHDGDFWSDWSGGSTSSE